VGGKANHLDPTKPVTTIKTSWRNVRRKAGVKGRLHDSRHTLVTELAESGAGDQTIKDIAGHVSPQMLKHYSHIRMKAKREALDAGLAETGRRREGAQRAAGKRSAERQPA
jgi:integrase